MRKASAEGAALELAPASPPPATGGKAGAAAALKNPLTLAQLSERRGHTDQARRLYREISERTPNDPLPYHRLAVMAAKEGKFKEAEPLFQRALELQPDSPQLLCDYGYLCYLCSRSEEAERYLRRALELEPNHPASCNNLALVVGEQGRYDEALTLFRRVDPGNGSLMNMAYVYAQRGDYERALETYNRVLNADPKAATAAQAMVEVTRLMDQRKQNRAVAARPPLPAAAERAAHVQVVETHPGEAAVGVAQASAIEAPR